MCNVLEKIGHGHSLGIDLCKELSNQLIHELQCERLYDVPQVLSDVHRSDCLQLLDLQARVQTPLY